MKRFCTIILSVILILCPCLVWGQIDNNQSQQSWATAIMDLSGLNQNVVVEGSQTEIKRPFAATPELAQMYHSTIIPTSFRDPLFVELERLLGIRHQYKESMITREEALSLASQPDKFVLGPDRKSVSETTLKIVSGNYFKVQHTIDLSRAKLTFNREEVQAALDGGKDYGSKTRTYKSLFPRKLSEKDSVVIMPDLPEGYERGGLGSVLVEAENEKTPSDYCLGQVLQTAFDTGYPVVIPVTENETPFVSSNVWSVNPTAALAHFINGMGLNGVLGGGFSGLKGGQRKVPALRFIFAAPVDELAAVRKANDVPKLLEKVYQPPAAVPVLAEEPKFVIPDLSVEFEFNKAELPEKELTSFLQKVGHWLDKHGDKIIQSGGRINFHGQADDWGTPDHNIHLSYRRGLYIWKHVISAMSARKWGSDKLSRLTFSFSGEAFQMEKVLGFRTGPEAPKVKKQNSVNRVVVFQVVYGKHPRAMSAEVPGAPSFFTNPSDR